MHKLTMFLLYVFVCLKSWFLARYTGARWPVSIAWSGSQRDGGRGICPRGGGAGDASQQRKNKKDNKFIVDNLFIVCYIEITPNAKGM